MQPAPTRSILTVKAVLFGSVLLLTIGGKSNSSARLRRIGVHIKPRPSVAMKLIISGETNSAAATKSPSFSRSSSSTTITTLPWAISSNASSMVLSLMLISLSGLPNARFHSFDIFNKAYKECGIHCVKIR